MKKIILALIICLFLVSCSSNTPLVSVGVTNEWVSLDNDMQVKINSYKESFFIKTWRGVADFPASDKVFIEYDIDIETNQCISQKRFQLNVDNETEKIINPDRIDGKELEEICENGNYKIYFEIEKDYNELIVIYINEDFVSNI